MTILNPLPLMAAKITKPIFFSRVIGLYIHTGQWHGCVTSTQCFAGCFNYFS